ncbi:magnesium transporter, partial [Zopfochytrium polystomum]
MSLLPLVWVGVLILVARSVAADPSGTANLTDPSKQQEEEVPPYYKAVGITLALTSGFFIGSSFIFKKKGLIDTNTLHGEVGAGHAYLKSGLWWTGMILMALGEFANFGAYAFTPAILVTPLGALSVVISAILASVFLKEKLNLSGKVGCAQCLIGATIIVLHAPATNATETIPEFFSYVLAPGFIVYSIIVAAVVFYLIYGLAPKYGDKNPIIYISICSIVGSFLVLSTQGFGSSIVYSARHWHTDNQFKQWAMYPLFGFIVFTVCVQIHFLNKALNLFSTAIVTPVYYVFFTTTTLISSAVLFRGFAVDSAVAGVSLVMGFLVIVGGVVLL